MAKTYLTGVDFKANMSPKDLMQYLCKTAQFGKKFDDRLSWFRAAQTAIRDELRKGRRMRAEGRQQGQWEDGQFRHPADFIDRDFWQSGDLNWMRILNVDYDGTIDAHNRDDDETLVDIQFCREEVELIWPRRNLLGLLFSPVKFEPFEKPPRPRDKSS